MFTKFFVSLHEILNGDGAVMENIIEHVHVCKAPPKKLCELILVNDLIPSCLFSGSAKLLINSGMFKMHARAQPLRVPLFDSHA